MPLFRAALGKALAFIATVGYFSRFLAMEKTMSKPFVAILMGSDSDLPSMEPSFEVLKSFGIVFEVKITSAHRTPKATHDYVTDADQRGCGAFICAAGMAAHLAGAVAATTLKPVIGVPINASLDGLDALLSTVQMPGGIPVATVAIGKAGAKNAAYLAAQILATADPQLTQQLRDEREKNAQAVIAKDAALQERLKA
jgi:5-(carboxyamino)imidazole ribonucleotide mutase